MKCPCCDVDLHSTSAPDVTLHACGRCGGLWLDNRASRMAAAAQLSEVALELARGVDAGTAERASQPYREPSAADTVQGGRKCPICAQPLARAMVQVADTELDVCGSHGTWFDRHELWTLVQAVRIKQTLDDSEAESFGKAVKVDPNRGARMGGVAGFIIGSLFRGAG